MRYILGVVALAAAYYAVAQLGYTFEFAGPVAAIVWLPVGVGITFLYLGGLRFWPGVIAGDLIANNYSALPLGSAVGQTCGNLLEVVVATVLMRRLLRRGSPLASISNLGGTLAAIAVGVAVSATIGSVSLRLGHVITTGAVPKVWRTWWLGDFCGAVIVVPLAFAWVLPQHTKWTGRAFEAGVTLAAVVGLSELAFRTHNPFPYLVFPPLIWSALRFGQQGATIALTVATGFTVWATTHYLGPFFSHSINRSVLGAQLYIAVAAISTLSLAAAVSEREEFAERLSASRARLIEAAAMERRRLQHNLHDGAQQRLIALLIRLGTASERVRETPEEAANVLEDAVAELSLAVAEVRELAHGIHPAALTRFGLARAIEDLSRVSTVPITVLEAPSGRLEESIEATAYYLVAEAVTNAQKYARASSIGVRAALAPRGLHLEVVDDGVGGATEHPDGGLQGLRDRVEAVGGTFEVDSRLANGTRIIAVIPTGRHN